ncbi:hypothetical protein KUCAC02_007285 [Chaenocephalus aceratus]|uniref:Uncharacterized protein n=1 Tax=Chaenocephalus aceratus TaxID=36190 RepID=A0ACB9X530_CHAAC|nr:hypothetical protein KUCAC02_007285 [Chaenocephalus aceratus]
MWTDWGSGGVSARWICPAMGKEASRAQQSALREDPEAEADKEVLRLGMEKEETESSDDNTTQYSIHPPFDFHTSFCCRATATDR